METTTTASTSNLPARWSLQLTASAGSLSIKSGAKEPSNDEDKSCQDFHFCCTIAHGMAPVIYFVVTAMSVSSVSSGLWPNLLSKDQTDWQNILCVQCAAALTVEAAHDH